MTVRDILRMGDARLLRVAQPVPAFDTDERYARLVSAAFSQRRKTLRNTLKGMVSAEQLAALGINAGARAQELSVADFVRIAEAVSAPA